MKKSIIAGVAILVAGAASAAIYDWEGTQNTDFTVLAGDTAYTTNGNSLTIADDATATITIEGTWIANRTSEVAFGGVNYNATQDVTLKIGSEGSVSWGKAWIGDGPDGGTIKFDIDEGGTFTLEDVDFVRWHPSSWSTVTGASMETMWDAGNLTRNGEQVGTFAENFTVSDLGSAFTLQAIPEPGTLGLIGVFGGGMLFVRRRFMI
jgi:hypothetical protein